MNFKDLSESFNEGCKQLDEASKTKSGMCIILGLAFTTVAFAGLTVKDYNSNPSNTPTK